MPMNVRMPDGTVVQNVPDGTTRSQLMQRYERYKNPAPAQAEPANPGLQAKSPPAPAVSQAQPAATAPQAPIQEPNFAQRVGQDIQKRQQMGVDIMQRRDQQNPLSTGLQMAGKVAFGTASDIASEAGKSIYQTLVPEGVQEKIKGGIQRAMATPLGQAGLEAAKRGGLAYVEWAKEHPEAAGNIEALVDIATFIPIGKAAGAASKVITKPTGMESFGKGVSMPSVEKLVSKKNIMTKSANKTIEASKANLLPSNIATGLSNDLSKLIDSKNKVAAGTSPRTLSQIDNLQAQLNKGDYSLENIIDVRNELSDIRAMGGKDGISASKAIKKLDKAAKDAGITGYEKGYRESARAKQYGNIVKAVERAGNNAGKMREEMQTIINSGKIEAYPEKIQKLIRRGASGKLVGNVLQFADEITKGIPIIGPVAKKTLGATAGTIAKGTVADILKALEK